MRPQQNRRMRGRGNNNNNQNRKGPNPLTRSYESNGPDVKIRGSAQQIAEKYTTLARDAQSSGDRVMAENYLQHAEHYNRIIMAAQAQMPQQPVRDNRDDDDLDEDGDDAANATQQNRGDQGRGEHQDGRSNGSGPQPVIDGVPAEVALKQGGMPDNGASQDNGGAQEGDAEASADDGEAQEAPRRARRPRRPRAKPAEGAGSNDDQPTGETPVTEAAQ